MKTPPRLVMVVDAARHVGRHDHVCKWQQPGTGRVSDEEWARVGEPHDVEIGAEQVNAGAKELHEEAHLVAVRVRVAVRARVGIRAKRQ